LLQFEVLEEAVCRGRVVRELQGVNTVRGRVSIRRGQVGRLSETRRTASIDQFHLFCLPHTIK